MNSMKSLNTNGHAITITNVQNNALAYSASPCSIASVVSQTPYHGRRKRGCRGCSCAPIQKLGLQTYLFAPHKISRGPCTVVVREIANFS